MHIVLRRTPLSPVTTIKLGYAQRQAFPCLIDTGFSGHLVGFIYPDHRGRLRSSIDGVDLMQQPTVLPARSWSVLADGRRAQTLSGAVLCTMDTIVKECEIRILHTPGPQDVPVILGMSFMRLFSTDLSIHFSTKTFSINVQR